MKFYLKYFKEDGIKSSYSWGNNANSIEEYFNVDFAIYNHEDVFAISIYDKIEKNKALFKYFDFKYVLNPTGINNLSVKDFDDKKFNRQMAGKFLYKVNKEEINSHIIFYKNNSLENCIIDWNSDGKIECIKQYLINKLQIPVTNEVLIELFGSNINDKYYLGVEEYKVYSSNNKYENIKCYSIGDGSKILEALKNRKFKTGLISQNGFDWSKINTLNEYVLEFNKELMEVLKTNVKIRFNAETDLPDMNMFKYKRMPFKGQIQLIEGAKRTLDNLDYVMITAQMATGKTFIGTVTNDLYYKSKGISNYMTIIVCPNISLKKWKREIKETLSNVNVEIFERTSDFIKWRKDNLVIDKPTYIIVSKETIKLGYAKTASTKFKDLRIDGVEYKRIATCPDCGKPLYREIKKDKTYLTEEDFKKNNIKEYNYKCIHCKSVLWSAQYIKTAKTSLIDYCKRKNMKFDSCIIDEFHSAKSSSTAIGYAFANVLNISNKKILLSGTMNNGLASSLFPLFMRLFPRKMFKEGYDIKDMKKFIEEYGTMDTLTKIKTINKWTEEKKESYKEKAGINPIVYTKFLSECCISATLDDLGIDMPEYNEYPVYVELEDEIVNNASSIMEVARKIALSTQNPIIVGVYENAIARHYINNPYGWNDSGLTIDINEDRILNKEQALLDLVKEKLSQGKKCFVFTDFTGGTSKHQNGETLNDRLCRLLKQQDIKVKCLKTNIKPIDREGHIKDHDEVDVWVSNPILVKESLDLIDYPVLIYYNFGYEPMLIEQSSRRAYRPEQKQDCETYFFYTNYIEDKIIKAITLKRMEMQAIEGKFNISDFNLIKRTASELGRQLYEVINIDNSFEKMNESQVNAKVIKLRPEVNKLYD